MDSIQNTLNQLQNNYDKLVSCQYRRTLIQSLKSFLYAYSFKTIIAVLSNLKNIKKDPLLFLKLFFRREQINSGLFLGSYCLVMKIINIILNKFFNHQSLNSFLSGFLGGIISMQFMKKDFRAIFGLYTATRSFDMFYQAYIKDRWFKNFKQDKTLILCCLLFFMGYFFAHEPGVMPTSIVRFYVIMAREHENDRIFHQIWVHITNNQLIKQGIEPHDPYNVLYSFLNKNKQ